ncbi:MAG: hypothetical protein PVH88_17685 [Ignavibacteria bacterium]
MIKADKDGNKKWGKNYSNGDGYSGIQTTDGGFAITGSTATLVFDVLLLKTDNQGNIMWQKNIGGSSYDAGYSILQTSDAGYVVTGYTYTELNSQLLLLRTDVNGNKIFENKYGNRSVGYSIKITKDGNCIITGHGSSEDESDVLIIKDEIRTNL